MALCHDIAIPVRSAVNEFIGASLFAMHYGSSFSTDGSGLMRKQLVAWTLLTSALLAVAVWTVLGPPDHPAGPHFPSRDQTASTR